MRTRRSTLQPLLAAVVFAASAAALAQNPFSNVTSTVAGYHTWDSDLINVENVAQTGKGVYVAVLDTGMVPNWRDYFPEARVATHLGAGFHQPVSFKAKKDVCGFGTEVGALRTDTWVGSRGSTHGTHVASTILGYFYRSNFDAVGGYPLPPIMVRGIAPDVTVIPIKVLADYQVPALPKCGYSGGTAVFGTSEMVAAGIRYATDLKLAGFSPMVINMSLGGSALDQVEKEALDYAIANGVIVVAAAGNEGEAGMGYPGAYAPVISAGSPVPSAGRESGSHRRARLRRDRATACGGCSTLTRPFWPAPPKWPIRPRLTTCTCRISAAARSLTRNLMCSRPVRGCAVRSRATPATTTCRGGRGASATSSAGTRAISTMSAARRWRHRTSPPSPH